jgi:hypothetical protein
MEKPINVPLLFSLWNTDIENRALAEKLGIANSRLWEIKKRYGLPSRKRRHQTETDDPTPEEIAERSAQIRAKWTDSEESLRRAGTGESWRPPSYSTFDRQTMSFRA